LSCLRTADASTLWSVNNQVGLDGFFGTIVWRPVIDGKFIIESPFETLRKGNANGVINLDTIDQNLKLNGTRNIKQEVLLAVTNSFEGLLFVSDSTSDLPTFVANVFPSFGSEQIHAVVAQYKDIGVETTLDHAVAIMGECEYGVYDTAQNRALMSAQPSSFVPHTSC
jgi:hypothetical protein